MKGKLLPLEPTPVGPSQKSEQTDAPALKWIKLQDLAPQYEPEMHSGYLRALIEGLEGGRATNIALSGPYGAGKSSILQGLVARYREQTVQVSLATVRSTAEGAARDSVEGKRPEANRMTDQASVNDLQKEIVKQILYVVDPAKTPASRFARTGKFRWLRSAAWAVLAGAVGVAIQWVVTVAMALLQSNSTLTWRPDLYIPTFAGVAITALLLLKITNGRLRISDFSAGPAKLTLADKDGSYFDDYLDEIVYFFQASKKRILILEDMDRFSNVEVFEDLRALNVLLNQSAQLQSHRLHGKLYSFWNKLLDRCPWKKGELELESLGQLGAIPASFHDGPIVFVYAIRDSLLASTVKVSENVHHDAFARTKFFDLIVPVVPFVTEQNARGALKKELDFLAGSSETETNGNVAQPSDELVRQIAQYFPDQRQIRNIRNEFAMYRNRLLQPGCHPEELTADRLLALVLYKNLEVADFERIRLGNSKLHTLKALGDALVSENLARINFRLSHPAEAVLRVKAAEVAKQIMDRANVLQINFVVPVHLNGYPPSKRQLTLDELSDLNGWRQIVSGTLLETNRGDRLNHQEIETAFGVSLSFAEETAAPLPEDERHRLEADRRELEAATWQKLWALPQFTISPDSKSWPEDSAPDRPRSFAQTAPLIVGEGLTSDLISSGNLTSNFALLSAHFDVQFLSVEAQNFLQTSLGATGRTPLAPVSPSAIKEILADRSALVLERSGMVNVHVLNYLIGNKPNEAHRLLGQLRSWTNDDATFIRDFFNEYGNAVDRKALASATGFLASLASEVIPAIVDDPSLKDDRKVCLFEQALVRVQPEQFRNEIAGDVAIVDFAQRNHARFTSLTSGGVAAVTVASRLIEIGTTIEDLAPLSAEARPSFVNSGLFMLNVANLRIASGAGDSPWVPFDQLMKVPGVYDSTLNRIEDYLELLEAQEDKNGVLTAESSATLVRVLNDLANSSADVALDLLRQIARKSAESAIVQDIADCPEEVQEALLIELRAEITVDNLVHRLDSGGKVTEGIATALHAVPKPEHTPETDASELITSLLVATHNYPNLVNASVMSQVFEHLEGAFTISTTALLGASPKVAVRLIDDGWLETAELRREADSSLEWEVRKSLLLREPAAEVDETKKLLTQADVEAFLACEDIDVEVRAYVQFYLDELLSAGDSKRIADAVIDFYNQQEIGVRLDEIHQLAAAGAAKTPLLRLLSRPPARETFMEEPRRTLEHLGGDYVRIIRRPSKSPKFPNDPEHDLFLSMLASAGVLVRMGTTPEGLFSIKRK